MPLLKPVAFAAAIALLSFPAFAEDAPVFTVDPAIAAMTADQKVAAREAAMKEDGGLLKAASRTSGAEAVKMIDKVLQNFTNFPALFADGATNDKSEALPIIWTEFDKFTALVDKGKAALLEMRTAATAGDQTAYMTALKSVGGVCGECHQTYRQ